MKMIFSPAIVGISFTRSHPLQYHTDRRCWFAAKEVAERTNNNKSIPNYKRFSVFWINEDLFYRMATILYRNYIKLATSFK